MPDVASVLKEEIQRLARKEVRSSVDPLKKQVLDLKRRLREAERTIEALRKSTQKAVEVMSEQTGAIVPEPSGEEGSLVRIPEGSIRKHRERLGLTQAELAKLISVTPASVMRWENGHSQPRSAGREAFARVREMGVREAKARLEQLA